MNILIVSPWLPHPAILHAGGQHVWHAVRTLSERGHCVHVLCYGRGEPTSQVDALAARCASLRVIVPAYTWEHKFDNLRRGGWRRPWLLGRRTHHAARAALHAVCGTQQIDVVHFAWTEMGRYLDAVPAGVGTVLGTFDVEYRVRPREVALYAPGWAKIWAGWRARYLIQIERQSVARAHVTLACSAADRDHLGRLVPVDRVHVVPPWFDADRLRQVGPDSVVPGRLTFMGAMDRLANVAAARFLIEAIWPVVRREHPGAVLRIVGANPPDVLCRLAGRDSRLEVMGFVPDLAAEWASTDVAVVPSLIGGGLVTKVVQPMIAGRPVVTTTPGNEGAAAPVGTAVEVADDAPAFAAAVLHLLTDRDHWARFAAAGRRHMLATPDWHACMDRLETAYDMAKDRS